MPHTPGPWHAWDRGIGWEVHVGSGTDCPKRCDDINAGFRGTFEQSDAQLIAAAPDLLKALKDLTLAGAHNGPCDNQDEYGEHLGDHCTLHVAMAEVRRQKALEAIAKAEGRNA